MRIKILLCIVITIWVQSIFAQTQQGYVRTLGRPGKKGEALSGVTIRVKGEHNPVVSNNNGNFSLLLADKKNGDAYSLQQVQKNGYELNETDMIGRKIAFSDKVPLTIVMVSTEQLQADKQCIENNAYKAAEKNYKAKYNLLEKQLNDNKITSEQYRKEIQDLQDKFEKYQSLIDGLAEHYAHTDYDLLNEEDREINICIENGELERADSLIHILFDPIDVLERNKKALEHIEQQIDEANAIITQAKGDLAAVLKKQEKDAEYLYQLYTIALARFDNEKALYYIETRAELDTTNPSWQFDAGYCFQNHNSFIQAKNYYSRALGLYRQLTEDNPKAYEPDLASTLNNLAILYKNTQHLAESETLYLEALAIYKRLAKKKPKQYEPDVARTLNNLAILYSNAHRLNESETMYLEAIDIRRHLTKKDPQTHEPSLAMTLNNLATLYNDMQRPAESESIQLEALEIQKRLAATDPQTYEPDLARTLNNLAVLYSNTQRIAESKVLHLEALEIYRRLAKNNPQTYEPALATTLNNLADLYLTTQHFSESETLRLEALEICRRWAKNNPQIYEHVLAKTLNNLAILYENTQRQSESETLFLEASEILNRLSKNDPQTYEPDMATTLQHLADIYFNTNRLEESETLYIEALKIYRSLAQSEPIVYETNLVSVQSSLAVLYYKTQRFQESETMYIESAETYRHLAQSNPQVYEPRLTTTLYSLGLLYWQQDLYIQATPIFEEALALYRTLALNNPSYQKWYDNTLYLLTRIYQTTEEHTKFITVNEERLSLLEKRYQDDTETYKNDYTRALCDQSYQCIFASQLEKAEQYALDALSIDSSQIWANNSLSVSKLFQGNYSEAEAIYLQYKDELKDSFLQDLTDFEAAGIIPEERKGDVERIRKMLNE